MIEIRYQAFITHGNESYCSLEAFIVAFQFLRGSSKDGVVPMAKKLDYKPQREDREQNPFADGLKKVIANQPHAVQAKHGKLCTLDPHSFHKNSFPEAPCNRTSQKPYPKQQLHECRYCYSH